ncbi:adenylate/guanylate cyclase domain-containing protein [Alteromonas sp. ASW11-36]|uniref:Adenylate/guanylate cyclase domain-containing protein n=1 Tax=Alteromonas arenosi TaxID=3055817 RepID=A0ABT7SYG9_9ALTE|nr:adenylate/guanylate cyclase domain-containing protein [Alteromonas sp. ASW11-36]MDM7861235.1 adenylate/guanylate cyclase domain-containing protein [Alteromonas sp. ASW11-36]
MGVTDWLIIGLCTYSVIITALLLRRQQMARQQDTDNLPSDQRSDASMLQLSAESSQDAQTRFQEKADEALRLTQTFQKFVPRQFVDHFAKHGSSNLELGRADEDDVAILFCDIRGFTGLSERMKPQELMKFLNSYFLRMNDPIHQNGGFIDKFIGDAIMALFDHPDGSGKDKAHDALNAAIDLHHALRMYNQHRANSGYDPIEIGIGIHFGAVIIGTVGSDDRMDTTVIGDSVNIANRLEALAPYYNADIVVSEQLLATAKCDSVQARLLDWVKVKGRSTPLKIYEVITHLPEDLKARKLSVAKLIEQAVDARIEKRFDDALASLQQALATSSADPLILHHIEVCHRYKTLELPGDWDGALTT